MMEDNQWIELVEGKQWSRLLYPNPVCFLTTTAVNDIPNDNASATVPPPVLTQNVMVLSWLTPTNNHGAFMCSINQRRCSASRIVETQQFCLSVPTRDLQQLVLQVGSVSGSWGVSKFPDDHHPQVSSSTGPSAPSERTWPTASPWPHSLSSWPSPCGS